MARIRTIKPEFFTSEDIVELSMVARLLYIALWCEADREGRFAWKPRTFKIRYFPADDIDIKAACEEIVTAGLVRLYGADLAYIPSFGKHQHINPRESASDLPDPNASARVVDASARVSDVQGGREGREGREVVDASPRDSSAKPSRASRLPADWKPSPEDMRWAIDARPDIDANVEVESFRDYWVGKPGKDGTKADWSATWRNWIRRANAPRRGNGGFAPSQQADTAAASRAL